jgi:hypothetical protein
MDSLQGIEAYIRKLPEALRINGLDRVRLCLNRRMIHLLPMDAVWACADRMAIR